MHIDNDFRIESGAYITCAGAASVDRWRWVCLECDEKGKETDLEVAKAGKTIHNIQAHLTEIIKE